MTFSFTLMALGASGLGAGFIGFEIWKNTLPEVGLFLAGLLLETLLATLWLLKGSSRILRFTKICTVTGIWVGSWVFFSYFNTLPGRFAWHYLFAEPLDVLNLIASYFQPWFLLVWLAASAVIFFLLDYGDRRKTGTRRNRFAILIAIAAVVLLGTVVSGFRTNPGKGSPGFDLALSFFRSVYDAKISFQNNLVRLQPRVSTTELKHLGKNMPFNILLIVHESLRSENLSIYSYEKDTTPHLRKWMHSMGTQSHDVYKFENAYSNATYTHLSYPSLLSGVHPIEGVKPLHTRPLLFDYLKAFSESKTAIISSHSYETGNYAAFLKSPHLDQLIYRETENWEIWNNVGADDSHLPDAFAKVLDDFESQKFFVVLHHNGSHFPYNTQNSEESDLEAKYDQSIEHVDSVMDKVFHLLSNRKLLDQTLIMITSDHGESFGENGTQGHFGPIHPSNSKIPFIWFLPKILRSSSMMQKNIDKPVSNIDIVPTILGMLDIQEGRHRGRDIYNTTIEDADDVVIYNIGTGQPALNFAVVSEAAFDSYSYQLDTDILQHRQTKLKAQSSDSSDLDWQKVNCDVRVTADHKLIQACDLARNSAWRTSEP